MAKDEFFNRNFIFDQTTRRISITFSSPIIKSAFQLKDIKFLFVQVFQKKKKKEKAQYLDYSQWTSIVARFTRIFFLETSTV